MIEAAETPVLSAMCLIVPINTTDKALAHKYRKTSTKWSSVKGEIFDVILDAIYLTNKET